MKVIKTDIDGILIFEPQVYGDERGFFMETFRESLLKENGIEASFVQDNHSKSSKGVLRGLHFQKAPYGQDKLVRVIQGEVFDVCVDIRRDSPTFGKHIAVTLSAENKKILFVPKGFAHGFCVVSDTAEFLYKVSSYYAPEAESGIIWNDPVLGIKWPKLDCEYTLSQKDKSYGPLSSLL